MAIDPVFGERHIIASNLTVAHFLLKTQGLQDFEAERIVLDRFSEYSKQISSALNSDSETNDQNS